MEKELRFNWFSLYTGDGLGNMYGYSVHNNTLKKYVRELAVVDDTEAENYLQIIPPEGFHPVEGKVNWLFTMFEGEDVPDLYREHIVGKADYLMTPSTWVKHLFSKIFPAEKIFVVNHGIEPFFRYKKRTYPHKKKFRFLWVGAPNPRKGWEEVIYVWKNGGFARHPKVELYIKTTRVEGVHRNGNVVMDGRNLPRAKLLDLYHSSHCFLFPTRGEGFGFTLAEAMRTGMPCISPCYSGVTDFFDESVGFPISYQIRPSKIKFIGHQELGAVPTRVAFPSTEDLFNQMIEVCSGPNQYKQALERGARAHQRIRDGFTWERSARTFVDAIKGTQEQRTEGHEEKRVSEEGNNPSLASLH